MSMSGNDGRVCEVRAMGMISDARVTGLDFLGDRVPFGGLRDGDVGTDIEISDTTKLGGGRLDKWAGHLSS
jgi:hypothetical protein